MAKVLKRTGHIYNKGRPVGRIQYHHKVRKWTFVPDGRYLPTSEAPSRAQLLSILGMAHIDPHAPAHLWRNAP